MIIVKREYRKEYKISYTEVDQNLKLGLVEAMTLPQDMVTEYFETIKSDNIILKNENNAIWVVAKAKLHFNQYPNWRDLIYGRSYTTKVKPIRVEIETTFKNENEETIFSVKQESCAIDLDTRRIRKVETVNYPVDMEIEENVIQDSYSKLNETFSEDDFVYEQKVYVTDIDYSRHTNNVVYVRYIVNTLSCEFLDNNQITDFEIHYINESREGEILRIYKKEKESSMEFLIKEGEREIIRASLDYSKK